MKKILLGLLFIIILGAGIHYDLRYQWARVWHAFTRYEKLPEPQEVRDADKIKDHYAKLSATLPTAQNLQSFINSLLQEGQSEGLEFTGVNQTRAIQKDFLVELPVQLTIVGTYQQFFNFLKKLNNKHYSVVIDNWAMSRQAPVATTVLDNQNTPDVLVINTTAYFYYLP